MKTKFANIRKVNPALFAGTLKDSCGNDIATATFAWPSDGVIALAPITRPLVGHGIRHLFNAPDFAAVLRSLIGPTHTNAKLLHVCYQGEADFPLNTHYWMDNNGRIIQAATKKEIDLYVPFDVRENSLPDALTREYLSELNATGEQILAAITKRLGG